MFSDVDQAIKTTIIKAKSLFQDKVGVSFFSPKNDFFLEKDSEINFFLFEVKENRDLRDCQPRWDSTTSAMRRPPMRVNCSYLVTAWSKDTGEDKVKKEHTLLYEAFRWLNRFSTIPDDFLEGIKGFENKTHSPPIIVTHMSGDRSTGEFWQALGIPPRPAFYLTVTIEMDLNDPEPEQKVFPVKEGGNIINLEAGYAGERIKTELFIGVVKDKSQPENVIKSAKVELLNTGKEKETDADGYFLFAGLLAETYIPVVNENSVKLHSPHPQ